MDFKQLSIFVSVVDHNSFSLAAIDQGISQPTVSLQIKQLEEELDTPLFIRSTRELKLTDKGRELYIEAKKMLEHQEKVLMRFKDPHRRIMIIGVSSISALYILPKILGDVKDEHSQLKINIKETNSHETIRQVSQNEVDIGIVGFNNGDEDCEFAPIFKDELVIITPNNEYYQGLKKENADLNQLAKEPFIVRESGSGIKKNMERILLSEGIDWEDLDIRVLVNDIEVIKKLVGAGKGVSFISKVAVEEMVKRNEVLMFQLEPYEERFRHLYVVWNKKVVLPSYVKDFLNYILNNND